MLLALDAGHGKSTAGKRTPTGIAEWTLNSQVAERIEKLLKKYENVEIIRLDDVTGKVDKKPLFATRLSVAINKKVDACVSIHHNAETLKSGEKYGTATGVEVWISTKATAASKTLAAKVLARFASNSGMKNRGVKASPSLTMVMPQKFPTILIEGGFMNSKKDIDLLSKDSYQNAYAEAVVGALVEQFGLKVKGTTVKAAKPVATKTEDKKVYKTTANLNLRKTPVNGEIIITIPVGTKVTIIDKSSDWYKIKVTINKKTYTGYAFGRTYINLV